MRRLELAALSALACGMAAPALQATVIFNDSLTSNNGESGALNGSNADTTGAGTWTSLTSSTAYTRTSSGTTITSGGQTISPPWGASFPVSISSGFIYTLQCTFSITAGNPSTNGDWVTIQFNHADQTELSQGAISGHSEYEPWMFVRTNDYTASGFKIGDGGFGGGAVGATTFTSSTEDQALYTLSVVLNTTGTYWSATYYENGTQVGTYTYSSGTPNPSGSNDIEAISIGAYESGIAMATNFSLIQTPEPASLGILGIGSIGLLTCRGRRPAS